MDIGKESVGEWNAGSGTATTTPAALPAYPAKKHVIVRADAANTAAIKIGPTEGGSASGFSLGAGEYQAIPIDDSGKVWVVAASGSQGYSWAAI